MAELIQFSEIEVMQVKKNTVSTPIDLSFAGWFLIAASVWELLFNRAAAALGIYRDVGASGFLAWFADSGRLAMNAVGTMALILACVSLPVLANNRRFASLTPRVVFMLASPFYLPIICVAIFRVVSPELILIGYLIAAASAMFLSVVISAKQIDKHFKRVILGLGLIELLGAFELTARFVSLFHEASTLEAIPRKAYLLAEILFVVTPLFALFAMSPGKKSDFFKKPHLGAIIIAALAASIALGAFYSSPDTAFFKLVAFRTLGVTLSIPGGIALYVVALFAGTWLIGALILPSRRQPPTQHTRRLGFGLACVWLAGIQPTHPYQFALMVVGFLYLARGVVEIEKKQQLVAVQK